MSEHYHFNSTDYTLLKAAELLLRKAASAEATKLAERVSIAKLQHVLAALPRVTPCVDVKVSVVSPHTNFGEIETFHWWDVAVEDDRISISSGGHFFRPSTGGDSFTTMSWTAIPEYDPELDDYRESLRMVPDVYSFPEGVARIDLSVPDFRLKVTDEDNRLLDDEFGAFLKQGWPGFEQEFDRIVDRGRPDYEQIKRALLREPIFSVKAHRNLARGLAAQMGISDESFEDVLDHIVKRTDDRKAH